MQALTARRSIEMDPDQAESVAGAARNDADVADAPNAAPGKALSEAARGRWPKRPPAARRRPRARPSWPASAKSTDAAAWIPSVTTIGRSRPHDGFLTYLRLWANLLVVGLLSLLESVASSPDVAWPLVPHPRRLVDGLGLGIALTLVLQAVVSPAAARIEPSPPGVTPRTPLGGSYRSQVLKVIDGDTLEARVHVWMGQELITRVRLLDIDAPEFGGACAEERRLAGGAQTRLAELVGAGPVLLADVRPDKYFGRVVGRIILPRRAGCRRGAARRGPARPYRGGARASWCGLAR